MPAPKTRTTRKAPKVAPILDRARDFMSRYSVLEPDELLVAATWAIGTWTFSPASPASPATYPYLYITAPAGAGKSRLGLDVMGALCRMHQSIVGITGAGVFRLMGDIDEDSGAVIPNYSTLALDEIDATFSGAKDEPLRQQLNAGYRRGATVPRTFGKTTYAYPVYGPKLLIGIDNGHLPETVTTRTIRIDLRKYSQDELEARGVQEMYSWDVEEEIAELHAEMSAWVRDNAMILRDYRPDAIPGLAGREWEISRSLVQLAKALGCEDEMREALKRLFDRKPPATKVAMYKAIFELFEELDEDRLTTQQILARLKDERIPVPGDSGMGLAGVLAEDGIRPQPGGIRLRPEHPGVTMKPDRETGELRPRLTHRGYFRHEFDFMFGKHVLNAENEEDE